MPRRKNNSRAKNPINWDYREPEFTQEQTDKWLIEFRKSLGIKDPHADISVETETRIMIEKCLPRNDK